MMTYQEHIDRKFRESDEMGDCDCGRKNVKLARGPGIYGTFRIESLAGLECRDCTDRRTI